MTADRADMKAESAMQALARDVNPASPFASMPWPTDDEALLALLILASCPIICNGRVTDDNDWHQTCISRGVRAMEVLRDIRSK